MGEREAVCAVFMPMLLGYEGIRAAVRDAIEAAGATMWRLEDLLPDAEWQLWVVRSIEAADLVVADVTDNNPFVMYELGVAHAHRVPSLLILNRGNGAVPATVKGSYFLSYDEDQLPVFVPRLANAIRRNLRLSWHYDAMMPAGEVYSKALDLLATLPAHMDADMEPVTADEFSTFMQVAVRRGEIPAINGDARDAAEILLARLIKGSDGCQIMDLIEQSAGGLAAGGGA